jgi:hypothetical protein
MDDKQKDHDETIRIAEKMESVLSRNERELVERAADRWERGERYTTWLIHAIFWLSGFGAGFLTYKWLWAQ